MEKTLTMATKNESKAYIRWKKDLYYSLIAGLVIGCLSSFIPTHSLIQSIMIGFLTTGLGFVIQVQIDIMRFFRNEVEHNPIIMALPEISKKIQEIPDLFTKNGSVDFAVDSLKKMSDEGFIQFNVEMKDYIKYLIVLVENTKNFIYGTNIFRPEEIIKMINSKTSGITEYLKTIREYKCKQKTRIVVLSKNDIQEIIQAAVTALTKQSGKIEYCRDEFIPEIVWYLREICGWQSQNIQKIDLLWTTHDLAIERIQYNNLPLSETSMNEIDDYAIFDNQILFLYDHNEKTLNRGTMLLQWDLKPTKTSKVGKYLEPFQNIADDLPRGTIDGSKNLFSSFSELMNNIKWGKERIRINGSSEIKSQFSALDPGSVYSRMGKMVNTEGFKFKENYFEGYFQKTL